jgi:hypothetical protein
MVGSEAQESHAEELDQASSLALLECLSAATSLTSVELIGGGKGPQQAWCRYLTSLQQLRCLTLNAMLPLNRADLLQLTALTNLWCLEVDCLDDLDYAAAVALVLPLKQLRQLSLESVPLTCPASLPAIATLTGLTKLSLSLGYGEQQQWGQADLQLLNALTGLRELDVDPLFDEEVVLDLWDAERGMWLQQQQL